MVESATNLELRRCLRARDLIFHGINSVIGTGIFFMPGVIAQNDQTGVLLAFAFSALLVLLLGVVYAGLSARVAGTGGGYLYALVSLGPLPGFVVGWLSWVALSASWAALAHGFAIAAQEFFELPGDWITIHALASIGIVVGVTLNCRGVHVGGGASRMLAYLKLVALIAFVAMAVPHMKFDPDVVRMPLRADAFGEAALLLLYCFVGFETIPVSRAEAIDPERTVPRALLVVWLVLALLYGCFLITGVGLDLSRFDGERATIYAIDSLYGVWGKRVILASIMVSTFGIQIAMALNVPRYLFALAERCQLPRGLARVNAVSKAPVNATVLTGAVVLLLSTTGGFTMLATMSATARVVQYGACAAALGLLIRSVRRPLMAAALGGLALSLVLMYLAPVHLWTSVGGAVLVGLAFYALYRTTWAETA